jgi:hypothetical protein
VIRNHNRCVRDEYSVRFDENPDSPYFETFYFSDFSFETAKVLRICYKILMHTYHVKVVVNPIKSKIFYKAVPWLRRLVACLPPRRPGFDPGSVHVGFVVDKVALGQVFLRVLRFSPVNFVIFITGLHKKPQGCRASVASAAGPFATKNKTYYT